MHAFFKIKKTQAKNCTRLPYFTLLYSSIDFGNPRKKLSKNKAIVPKQALSKVLPHEDEKQQFFHLLLKLDQLCLVFIMNGLSNFIS